MTKLFHTFLCFCICLIFISDEVRAQSYSYKHFTVEDGLMSSTVYCSIQDSKGFMWFGTESGVNRFDGKTFQQFTTDDGLSDNEVFQIHEDSKGRIWFLTLNGRLSYFFNDKFYNSENDSLLHQIPLNSSYILFYEDSKHNLWFCSQFDDAIIISGNKISKIKPKAERSTTKFWSAVYEDLKGKIWLFSDACYYLENGMAERGNLKYIPGRVHNQNISKGEMVFFSKEGIVLTTDTVQELIYKYDQYIDSDDVNRICKTEAGNIWVCTNGRGCYLLKKNQHSFSELKNYLPGKIVLNVFEDNEKNVWFSTSGEGVYLLRNSARHYVSYTAADQLTNQQLFALAKDSSGNIWMGCSGGILAKLSGSKISNYDLNHSGAFYLRILSLLIDHEQKIWCASDRWLKVFSPDGFKNAGQIIPLVLGKDTSVIISGKYLNADRYGKIFLSFYFGVTEVLKKNRPASGLYLHEVDSTHGKRTFCQFFDFGNRMWYANNDGINRKENGRVERLFKKDKLLQKRILDIKETSDSTMIFSTDGFGIFFMKRDKIIAHFTNKEGLSSDVCRRISVRDSIIWISTNLGLTRIKYSENKISDIRIFNSADGLLSNDVRDVLDDGVNVYAATGKGLCVINNIDSEMIVAAPPLHITALTNKSMKINLSEIIKLPYDQNQLNINFTAITYQFPEKIIYQYKVNNEAWKSTNNSSIELSNLAPGNYNFFLRAKKINSNWCSPVSFSFSVAPPFWQTTWFLILELLVAMLLMRYAFFDYYRRKYRTQVALIEKQEAINRERSRIASDIHDDLGSELTSIIINSEILKQNESNPSGKITVDSISSSAREAIDKMSEIIWAMNATNDTLKNLIAYLNEYADKYFENTGISCLRNIPEQIPDAEVTAVFRRNVFLVVKETFHNILKHSQASKVFFDLNLNKNIFELSIKDDGKGFNESSIRKGAQGLNNLKKRIKEISGEIKIKTVQDEGTHIIVTLVF